MEYKIKELNSEVKSTIIEKTGHVITFSISQVEDHVNFLAKKLKELRAQLLVDKAKLTNIEENHPFVKDLSDQDLFTAAMYQGHKDLTKVTEEKITEIDNQVSEYTLELADIYKQLPELMVTESPYVEESED